MNKKLMFLFLMTLSFAAVAQMPVEEVPMQTEERPELLQEPQNEEAPFPQMQEDPSYDMPAEVPEDYENTEIIDDPSIDYEN